MSQILTISEIVSETSPTPLLTPIHPVDIFPPADIESNEPELESSLHLHQIFLLISCLEFLWRERHNYFAAGNLSIYFKPEPNQAPEFRGPDFFVVLGVEKKERKSWVVYHEGGIYPHVIVEILSDSTAKADRTKKKLLYQNVFRTPNYFWFDPETLEFQGFHLVEGEYVVLEPNERGHLWSRELQLFLGIHEGKLRYFTPTGDLVLTPEEAWQQEQERANRETQRAEEAIAQTEKLAAKLRELNIDPEQIS